MSGLADTAKPHRLFAWPRYDRPGDLQALAQIYGPVVANRADVRLCLRHDAAVDPPIEQAVRALEQAFTGALGADADVDVLLVDDALDEASWQAVAADLTTVLLLPSSLEPARRQRLTALGRPMVATGEDLRQQMTRAAGTPKVTAIISTHASARFLRGCLEDLVGQTLYAQGLLEIIVVDSGSPENEGEIVRQMQARHPDIRYLRTERETLYAAWNRAVALARGTYLTNANADDRHRPDALEVLAAALDRHADVAVVYADQLVTQQPNETFARHSATARFGWPDFSYPALQQRCIVGPQPMWRRSLHDRWGMFDPQFTVAGDYEFWMRIGRDEKFLRVPEVLGLYYQNGAGLEFASGERTARETIEIQRRYGAAAASAPTAAATPAVPPAAVPAPGPRATTGGSPLVSVIMPTFNRPDFLCRALDSLLGQTFADFEVVVVNDAGAPIESMLCERYGSRLAITYLRQAKNRDRSAARNAGLSVARGQYIAYLDDDDCYLPEHLATLVGALRDGRHQVAFTEALLINEKKTNGHYTPGQHVMRMALPFHRERLLVYNDIPILCLMHHRSCLDAIGGGFDEALATHEDWDLLIRLAQKYEFVQLRKLTAVISWREDGSTTTSGRRDDFRHTLALIHDRYRALAAASPEVLARQAEARGGATVPSAPETAAAPPLPIGAPPRDRARDLVARAQALFLQGEVARARQLLAGGVDLAPHAPEVVLALADIFAVEGKVDAACDLLVQLGRLHPTLGDAARRRDELIAQAGERARAQQAATRAFASAR
ncbi:MAG TPA: glycosyltransferase [Polyangia bacterium]|nr:glycosyltransferase [Polyangia bacterium]